MSQTTPVASLCRVIVLAGILVAGGLRADECVPQNVGVPSSQGEAYASVFLGKALGNTFHADEPYIRSISVFRRESSGDDGEPPPMKLWITRTNILGEPLHDAILLDGPVLRTDGIGAAPYRVTWEFDPPFALPGPGNYAFFIQDPCFLTFSLLAHTSNDAYASGQLWRSGHETCDLNTPYYYIEEADWDLVFDVELCPDTTTAARRDTWGRLKLLYR